MSGARYFQLAQLIRENKWRRGAELGVFSGRTHFFLLDNCPMLENLIGVDVWDMPGFKEFERTEDEKGKKCHCAYCNETRTDRQREPIALMRERVLNVSRTYEGRSTILQMTTNEAAMKVAAFSLDFVFIDADHSFNGVSQDIRHWASRVRPGGLLCGHDFNMPGVRRAVESVYPFNRIRVGDDHLWMVTL